MPSPSRRSSSRLSPSKRPASEAAASTAAASAAASAASVRDGMQQMIIDAGQKKIGSQVQSQTIKRPPQKKSENKIILFT